MQDHLPQNAGGVGAELTRVQQPQGQLSKVSIATFRFAAPPRFELLRLAACAGGKRWLGSRATAGVAAVILGLADGRSINSNTPTHAPAKLAVHLGETP